MNGKETIILIGRADARLIKVFRIPNTDEEKDNFRKLTNTGAEKLLCDLRDKHVLYQRIVAGFDINENKVTRVEPAVVNIGNNFRSVGILFDGATNTTYDEGSFIRMDLVENEEQLSLTYKIDNNSRTSKLIQVTDLEDEVYKVLITRETSSNFESRQIRHK